MGILVSIISYSKLLGNYNFLLTIVGAIIIISYSKLLGNYNLHSVLFKKERLYHILNC